ncbi:hypothetical protein RJ035_007092 [Blastomyces gilchristii]
MFTTKLAIYYFRRQPLGSTRDRCLILIGSIAGYLGIPSSATYSMSKFVAPGYVITPAYTKEIIAFFKSKGVKFASEDDACKAVLRIASDTAVNGRSLAVVSKEDCAEGYFDLAQDDFSEGSKLHGMQDVALNVGSRT